MSNTNTPAPAFPAADAVCVLVDSANLNNILGGQNFSTYSPDGAKKAATKLEKVHIEGNKRLKTVLALLADTTYVQRGTDVQAAKSKLTGDAKLSDDDAKFLETFEGEATFLKEYGNTPKPESLSIRVIEAISLSKETVTRNTPKPVVELTPEQKAEKKARLLAQIAALEG
jgi:hypothetical protein